MRMNQSLWSILLLSFGILVAGISVSSVEAEPGGKGKAKKFKEKDSSEDDEENGSDAEEDHGKSKGKGKGKKGKGKGRGKKVGWGDNDVPPGIAKQGEEKIKMWKEARSHARGDVEEKMRKQAENQNKSAAEADADAKKAGKSLDNVIKVGVPIPDAKEVVEEAIQKGITADDIIRVTDVIIDVVKGGGSAQDVMTKTKQVIQEKAGTKDLVKALKEKLAERAAEAITGGKKEETK